MITKKTTTTTTTTTTVVPPRGNTGWMRITRARKRVRVNSDEGWLLLPNGQAPRNLDRGKKSINLDYCRRCRCRVQTDNLHYSARYHKPICSPV
jgi:hypothetical protein